ncbi:hypothetical protein LIER_36965 [Lithospermum erythrorhizon]|uniref:Uncharacterized protein n=1 Tax=Lithospermum erythrorhizon TaxID=34254 RepID=A0AAV3PI04_LITER
MPRAPKNARLVVISSSSEEDEVTSPLVRRYSLFPGLSSLLRSIVSFLLTMDVYFRPRTPAEDLDAPGLSGASPRAQSAMYNFPVGSGGDPTATLVFPPNSVLTLPSLLQTPAPLFHSSPTAFAAKEISSGKQVLHPSRGRHPAYMGLLSSYEESNGSSSQEREAFRREGERERETLHTGRDEALHANDHLLGQLRRPDLMSGLSRPT